VIRYLITDGSAVGDLETWLERVQFWLNKVDFVQIREPELTTRELARVAKRICRANRLARILVNDRADVAIAAGADGVHLRDGSVAAADIRKIAPGGFIISVACHSVEGARAAAESGADYIVLAPVFAPLSKPASRSPLGLDRLREAAASVSAPVIALGGITEENAGACLEAGAAGVAGISLFIRKATGCAPDISASKDNR
jgi:thiamine-phosphate pyrophosphorylase